MPEEPTDTMAKAKPSAPPEIHALPDAPEQTADTPPATELSIGEGPSSRHFHLYTLLGYLCFLQQFFASILSRMADACNLSCVDILLLALRFRCGFSPLNDCY